MPVENHVQFEKVKNSQRRDGRAGAEPPKPKTIDIQAAMEKQGVVAPKKAENALSKFRNNIKRNIASTNRSINTIGRKNPGTLTLV